MPRLTKAQQAEYDRVKAEGETRIAAAKKARDENPCQETREAYKNAWNEVGAALRAIKPPPKPIPARFTGNRAGQRQYDERQALQRERELDAARRRRWK